MEKMTKVQKWELIKSIVETANVAEEDAAIVMDFAETELTALATKAAKAKERAAAKKAQADELKDAVAGVLTDEFQTADAIAAEFANPEITKAKVVARLAKLVEAGVAVKDTIKTEDGAKRVAYKLA